MKTVRISIAALAAGAALGAVPALAAEERNARAAGAPGYFCKQQAPPNVKPQQPAFRECVRLAAQGRRQAERGDKSGGRPNVRAQGAPGRFCQADRGEVEGADPGSEAFRLCVRKAAQARRAVRS